MSKLQTVLEQTMPPGVYRFPSRASLATLQEEVDAAGWRLFHLDGASIQDKAGFLAASRAAFGMPQYVGNNWDAYEEAVNDLAWTPARGYVLLYDDAAVLDEGEPQALATALDILATAASNWQAEGKPFYTLLRNAGRVGGDIQPWPEAD